MSFIADVRCDRVKGYSWKYTTGYIANTRNKHRNTQYDHKEVFISGFFFIVNRFSKLQGLLSASTSLKIHNHTQPDFVRYIRIRYTSNEGFTPLELVSPRATFILFFALFCIHNKILGKYERSNHVTSTYIIFSLY
jgi:hypothetical protein